MRLCVKNILKIEKILVKSDDANLVMHYDTKSKKKFVSGLYSSAIRQTATSKRFVDVDS